MTDVEIRLALIAGAVVLSLIGLWVYHHVRARRRAAEFARPWPPEWRALLDQSLPLYRRMPVSLRRRLEPLVREFLADVEFVGCRGLVVTDEMRLMVAVQACLLVVERGPGAYSSLRSVLLYPDEFVVEEREEDEAGVVTEGVRALSGQSLETSAIVLSWKDVVDGAAEDDGYNVVLHEFAHHLDHDLGGALSDKGMGRRAFERWHEVLEREYEALCEAVERGEPTLIDAYGAEHPAEFFAVATEVFFELPQEMQQHHGRLYAELRRFYGLDPAQW